MDSLYLFWLTLHLLGLAVGLGAATVKLLLLFKCKSDDTFVPVYLQVMRPITRLIIIGLILLTVSGIGWLVSGKYNYTPTLVTKLVLVVAIWVIGPVIDNIVEPRFRKLAPAPGESPSPAFVAARKQLLGVEIVAIALFYAIMLLGVFLY